MNNFESKNLFLANLIIIVSLFILLFFTKDLYSDYQITKDNSRTLAKELQETNNELEKFKNIQNTILEEDKEALQRYNVDYTDSDILYFIHSLAESEATWISVENIKLSNWVENKYGFMEWTINIWVNYRSDDELLEFISKLTNSENYVIFIDEISFPFSHNLWDNVEVKTNKVSIPLTVYYK